MGYPVGPHYAEQSNVDARPPADRQIVAARSASWTGTSTRPRRCRSSTRSSRPGKDFELIVVPGGGHGAGSGPYGNRRRKDFFVKNLLGVEPPDRNNPPPKTASAGGAEEGAAESRRGDPARQGGAQEGPAAGGAGPGGAGREAAKRGRGHWCGCTRPTRGRCGGSTTCRPPRPTAPGCASSTPTGSAAVDKIEVASLSNAGTDELATLRKRIEKDRKDLEDAYRKTAEVEPLVPFAPTIVVLEEARRKLEPCRPGQARRPAGRAAQGDRQGPPGGRPTRRRTTCPTCI